MKKLELEVEYLPGSGNYVCRPAGQLGSCGNFPFLWTACVNKHQHNAEAKFRTTYAQQITNYETEKRMFNAVMIPTDGDLTTIKVEGYRDVQSAVGGMIELIELNKRMIAYINEEGKINELPRNIRATHLCRENKAIFDWDFIVGPMIVLGPVQPDGDDSSLDDALIRDLQQTYN